MNMKLIEKSETEKIGTLKGNPYFDELPKDALKDLAAHVQLREYARGDSMFWEGDPCAGLYIIVSGSIKLYRISPAGRQYIIAVLAEGATCNEVPAFDGGENPVSAETLEATLVWVVDARTLRELVKADPDFALKVLEKFGQNLRNLVEKISEMAFYQVTNRLARLIMELPSENKMPNWTQEQLAGRLGTVREVVARSLKELEKSGAIRIVDRRIHIENEELLHQWLQPYG
jgi:CRP/FNR family transcriptional regulator